MKEQPHPWKEDVKYTDEKTGAGDPRDNWYWKIEFADYICYISWDTCVFPRHTFQSSLVTISLEFVFSIRHISRLTPSSTAKNTSVNTFSFVIFVQRKKANNNYWKVVKMSMWLRASGMNTLLNLQKLTTTKTIYDLFAVFPFRLNVVFFTVAKAFARLNVFPNEWRRRNSFSARPKAYVSLWYSYM